MQKMLPADIWTIAQTREGNAVLLRPRNQNIAVPIFVGQLEIQSILVGKEGLHLPRPLTHDLVLNLLDSQELTLDRVEIHDLKDSTFHARLVILGGKYSADAPLVMDCRPSDAFGLATRRKCPIFISYEIVKETGIPLDIFIDVLENEDEPEPVDEARMAPDRRSVEPKVRGSSPEPANINISPLEKERHRLVERLNEAVGKEEYEEAARIRDILKVMEGNDDLASFI